jgi:hypothetical protein
MPVSGSWNCKVQGTRYKAQEETRNKEQAALRQEEQRTDVSEVFADVFVEERGVASVYIITTGFNPLQK